MKKLLALTLTAGLATAGAQTVPSLGGVELGLTGGYANGLSGELFVHVPNVAGPFGVKAGVALTRPSDPLNDDAEIVSGGGTLGAFKTIYEAAGGTVTESGSHTVFSLDGTYNVGELSPGLSTTLYAGGRYGLFRSTLTSTDPSVDNGAASSTTYSSNAFGIGAGVMVSYPISGNLSIVGDLGVDQFFKSTINVTSSDGTTNDSYATSDPGYSIQDNLFNRPGTVFKARIGLKTTF